MTTTTAQFTHLNLADVEDAAPALGAGEHQEARFATAALATRLTGMSLHRFLPGQRQPFGHRHEAPDAEEIYVVLAGRGRLAVGDAILELAPRDAVRVVSEAVRAFEAGDEGLEVLAFGTRHDGDGEIVPGFWPA